MTDSLEGSERIVFLEHLYWTCVCEYIFSALLMLLMAIGLFVAGYISLQELYLVGGVFFVLAILVYIVGWIFRTRCEFSVTNNRFIQKDGILNIRMTEIPLFKIEIVNFVNPLAVRKMIVGAINKNGNKDKE